MHSCVLTSGVTFCGCTVSPLYGKCTAVTGLKTALDRRVPWGLPGLAVGVRGLGPGVLPTALSCALLGKPARSSPRGQGDEHDAKASSDTSAARNTLDGKSTW